MKRVLLRLVVCLAFISCSSTPPAPPFDFVNSGIVNQSNANYSFHPNNLYINGNYRQSKTILATISGNELSFVDALPSEVLSHPDSNGFQYCVVLGFLDDNGNSFALMKDVGVDDKGRFGYASDYSLIYVNNAGSCFLQLHKYTFPAAGWYLISSKTAIPINETPPDHYWVVFDTNEKKVVWWMK